MDARVSEIEFRAASGSILRGRHLRPSGAENKVATVIMVTGDGAKGTKSLSWTNLPPLLLEKGIASFLFDFGGLGFSEGARETLTLSRGVEEYEAAFKAMLADVHVDANRIGILASSFGAAVALNASVVTNQAKLLGLKSPAPLLADAYLNEAGDDALKRWKREGLLPELGYRFEVLSDSLRWNTYLAAEGIHVPCLISHGEKDEIVPLRQSQLLEACLGGETRLVTFPGVGHQYSEEGAWDQMARAFIDWFGARL